MAEIVLEHLTKRFPDGSLAVNDFNLEIADAEFVILVGPSGCGKSTVLNMIAGLEDITSGELRIGGQVVNNKSPKDRDIAMVFQSYALYPHMTVRENMGFALKLAKTPQATITQKVDEAARILDLTQLLDRRPANMSGGQRQRVAMGRAIVRDPAAFRWTSRCRTWTPSCGCRRALRCRGSSGAWGPRWCTSRTTRSRP